MTNSYISTTLNRVRSNSIFKNVAGIASAVLVLGGVAIAEDRIPVLPTHGDKPAQVLTLDRYDVATGSGPLSGMGA